MNYGELKQAVSDEISRGTQLDSRIDVRLNAALRFLELNYSFKYMERYVVGTVAAGERSIQTPTRFKAPKWVRIVDSDTTMYRRIDQINPQEILQVGTGQPTAFWLDGVEFVWFDATPEGEQIRFDMSYSQFSDTMTADEDSNWLTENAAMAIVYQTMEYFSTVTKTPRETQTYEGLVRKHLKAVFAADEEITSKATDDAMIYEGGY